MPLLHATLAALIHFTECRSLMKTASLASDDVLLPAPVLVVEDDPLMRQRLSRVLDEIGCS